MNSDCPTGSECFTLEFRNRGPWPATIDILESPFYPSLTGPSVNVSWLGPGPDKLLLLIPFTGHTYTFWIEIMSGLRAPDRVYVILAGNVTVLYVSHYVVLHSDKRYRAVPGIRSGSADCIRHGCVQGRTLGAHRHQEMMGFTLLLLALLPSHHAHRQARPRGSSQHTCVGRM